MDNISTTTINALDLINLSKDIAQINLGYLGISVAILGVLGGVFIYFNIKPLKDSLNKQEKTINDLKEEADKLLEKAEEQSDNTLEDFKEKQSIEMSNLLKKQLEKTVLEIESESSKLEKFLLEKIDSISEDKDKRLKEIILSETTNKISITGKSLQKEISSLKASMDLTKQNIKNIERKIKELELEEFARKNQMGAIYRAIELLKDDIDKKSRYGISKSLERLKNQIKGIKLKVGDITMIEEQLVRLDSDQKYKTAIENVRSATLKDDEE